MNYNKFIEEKVLKLSSKKNYEKYPNQMKENLKEQVARYDLDVVSYNKNYYNLTAILKDKYEDRYIGVIINDLSCFEDHSYKCIALRIMKDLNDRRGIANRNCSWSEIGRTTRNLIEWKKREEQKQELDKEDEIEK